MWSIYLMGSGTVRSNSFGSTGDYNIAGDYNGDGITDLAVWRNGTNLVHFSPTIGTNSNLIINFGQAGDYPAAAFQSR